jgi:hypothetical protein
VRGQRSTLPAWHFQQYPSLLRRQESSEDMHISSFAGRTLAPSTHEAPVAHSDEPRDLRAGDGDHLREMPRVRGHRFDERIRFWIAVGFRHAAPVWAAAAANWPVVGS